MSIKRTSLLASVVLGICACTTYPTQQHAPQVSQAPQASVRTTPPPAPIEKPKDVLAPVSFGDLPGWAADDLREAWPAFLASCEVLVKKSEWKEPCSIARDVDVRSEKGVRLFFESFFTPYKVSSADGSDAGLVTGYYEPLLRGARKRGGIYQTPLHRAPDDLLTVDLTSVYPDLKNMRLKGRLVGNKVVPYPSRAEMMQANALAGKELLWVDDPIEAFFLQVQGSGRVQLADTKEVVRIAYADQNGHPYKSIGRYLVDKGEMTLEQASAQSIKAWFAANPSRRQELLNANPSYVFFKEEKLLDHSKGPKGSLGVPLTPQRSIAIDTNFIPLGVPVYLATTRPNKDVPLQRLMMAQDTGGAIKGAIRADFFWGFGAEAGELAGKMKQRGAMWVLLPKHLPVPATASKAVK
ncbi:murein transglycosylase A [Noviherbaspirillum sp.]|uniref:murein transglycosylase A n=1 Tax=Noviherbaspirillum sp. TaxID=1926288 RepID=UPI002FE17F6E